MLVSPTCEHTYFEDHDSDVFLWNRQNMSKTRVSLVSRICEMIIRSLE